MKESVLLVAAVALGYTLVTMVLDSRDLFPAWVDVTGPVTTFETRTVPDPLERLAGRRRCWRRVANVGVVVSYVLLAVSLVLVVLAAYAAVTRDAASEVNRPRNVLVVPGVNDFLPLAAAPEIVVALFVGIVVHELGHGLLARVESVDIRSMGLIVLALLPFGAYVDMDGEERGASPAARSRIYAAGVTSNLVVALGCLFLLGTIVTTSIAVVPGLAVGGVVPGSPADDAGLERGDVLTAVNGTPIEDDDDLAAALEAGGRTVEVDRADGESVTVNRSVVVMRAAGAGPNEFDPGTEIAAVDGRAVHSVSGLERELESRSDPVVPVTVRTPDGDGDTRERNATLVAGAFVDAVVADGPLADAGAPADRPVVVTRIGDEPVRSTEDLLAAVSDVQPGETVSVALYDGGGLETYQVTFGESETGGAYLGVSLQRGVGGLSLTDFGVGAYPAADHLAVVGGDGSVPVTNTPLDRVFGPLVLPFAGMIGLFTENFGGFVGEVVNFYTVTGPLSAVGGGVFVAATVLFWTGWLSFLVGVFNCLPVYPLDGGRLLRTATDAVVSRSSLSADPAATGRLVAAAVGGIVAFSVGLVVLGPLVFS
ncbi:site-2 protease family protein [Halopiger djelfimassiliensis]|uniref:site-2 protease family protein n=1 Tax=Halopiger djelfimassiliensis TaxID=1293047 RepID=UPI0006780FF6|nr:site-2 protease family protein [Halopiger djelfimassiliensis]